MTKRYYWLKLNEDFFEDDTISWLEEQDGGKDFIIFYMKLCLKSLKDDGKLIRYVGESLIPYDIRALAKLTNTPINTVTVAMKVFLEIGLISKLETGEIYMNQIREMIGSETRNAEIMRKKRAKVKKLEETIKLEKNKSVPYIDNYTNKTRYGGNYYEVLDRDGIKCKNCYAEENLCIHHIIGYREYMPESSHLSSLVTLCRKCHSQEHAEPHQIVTDKMLESIGFNFDLYELIDEISNNTGNKLLKSNNVTESYVDVKKSYTEKEKEKEKDIEKREREKTPEEEETSKIANFWDNNGFGISNIHGKMQLLEWLNDSRFQDPAQIIIHAMEIAAANNARTLKYIEGILKNWENENLLTLEEIKANKERGIGRNGRVKKHRRGNKPTTQYDLTTKR